MTDYILEALICSHQRLEKRQQELKRQQEDTARLLEKYKQKIKEYANDSE